MAKKHTFLWILLAAVLLVGLGAAIPPVRERVVYRYEQLKVRVRYTLFPPEKQVFVPEANAAVSTAVQQTVAAIPTVTSTATATATPVVPVDTATPTPSPTPLPSIVTLKGVRYIDQHGLWNYCAPASLAMNLSYWGWPGKREDIGNVVKPFQEDKNVMPYELADYVNTQTNLRALVRQGGTLPMLKNLLANGFNIMIEKGTFIHESATGKLSWMGHYNIVTGYDDGKQEFIVQDSYFKADMRLPYDTMQSEWRAFNYIYLVTYPPEKEELLKTTLGDSFDETAALQLAGQTASDEIYKLQGIDQYFAWFNRGTSLVGLKDFNGAAQAYDQAFALYPNLAEDKRPWRMLWYQTGPYFAYFYTGRYQDVINLATQTIDFVEKPYLEESFYWRGLARGAVGEVQGDIDDQKTALTYHPGFSPSLQELQRLGVNP